MLSHNAKKLVKTRKKIKTADLHDSIPIVASSDAEESEERHSKVAEVSMFA